MSPRAACQRDLLQVPVVDLFGGVGYAVIVFVLGAHVKDYRDSFAGVVVVVAAVEKIIRLLQVVVAILETPFAIDAKLKTAP